MPERVDDQVLLDAVRAAAEDDPRAVNDLPTFAEIAAECPLGESRVSKRLRAMEKRTALEIHLSLVPDKPGNVATVDLNDADKDT